MLGQLLFGHHFRIGSDVCVTVWGDGISSCSHLWEADALKSNIVHLIIL